MSEPLPDDLRIALRRTEGRRGVFGDPITFLTETGSTNGIAMTMAERGAAEGTMVVALSQTAGRGRLGRQWFSPPGAGLYASIVCRNAAVAPLLTLAGGVAVADGIRRATGLPVVIKWPNDVGVSDRAAPRRVRKIAGILAEGSTGADGLQYVVLGIGVNLKPAAYPAAIATRATSIEAELGRPADSWHVLAEVLAGLNEQVGALAAGNTAAMLARWRELSPSAAGAQVEWTAGGATHRGATAGIDPGGALLVRTKDGIERIVAGELTWL